MNSEYSSVGSSVSSVHSVRDGIGSHRTRGNHGEPTERTADKKS